MGTYLQEIELEIEQLDREVKELEGKRDQLGRLRRASAALRGEETPALPTSQADTRDPPPLPRKIWTGPVCSCGGRLYPGAKMMGGKQIDFLLCEDCKNEVFG